MGMSISKALMFVMQICFDWPNTMSSRYGEYNCLDVIRHVDRGMKIASGSFERIL
jgi:hypothetical protein